MGRLRVRLLGCWPIRHFHISHNAPYLPPNILHNLNLVPRVLSYPSSVGRVGENTGNEVGITFVFYFSWVLQRKRNRNREIENNANAKFWGQIRCIVGSVKVAYTQSRYNLGQSCILEEHFSKHRPTTPPPPGSSGVVSKRTPHSLGVCGKQRWTGGKGLLYAKLLIWKWFCCMK